MYGDFTFLSSSFSFVLLRNGEFEPASSTPDVDVMLKVESMPTINRHFFLENLCSCTENNRVCRRKEENEGKFQ